MLLVRLLRLAQFDVVARQFDLDDVGAHLRRDLCRVRHDVDGGLARLAQVRATRIGPHDDRQALGLGLVSDFAELPVHGLRRGRAGVDREADRDAAEPQRVVHAAGHRGERVFFVVQHVVVVEFQNQRHAVQKTVGARFQEAERRGVRVAARVDGELEVIVWIVAGRVRSEAARRAVLEPLIDRQDDQLAGPGQPPVIEQPREIRARPRIVALVPAQDFLDPFRHGGTSSPCVACMRS